jgi:hypothetical protein
VKNNSAIYDAYLGKLKKEGVGEEALSRLR